MTNKTKPTLSTFLDMFVDSEGVIFEIYDYEDGFDKGESPAFTVCGGAMYAANHYLSSQYSQAQVEYCKLTEEFTCRIYIVPAKEK